MFVDEVRQTKCSRLFLLCQHFLISCGNLNARIKPFWYKYRKLTNTYLIINNYWARLSKILWFLSGEQINYLPKAKAEVNICSARHWQITIFCDNEFNNCFIIRSPFCWSTKYVKSLSACSGNRSIIFTRAYFQLRMSRILFAVKHLFVGSYLQVTWWALGQFKGKKKKHRMIIVISRIFKSSYMYAVPEHPRNQK